MLLLLDIKLEFKETTNILTFFLETNYVTGYFYPMTHTNSHVSTDLYIKRSRGERKSVLSAMK